MEKIKRPSLEHRSSILFSLQLVWTGLGQTGKAHSIDPDRREQKT